MRALSGWVQGAEALRTGPSRGAQWPAAAQNSTAVNPGATHSRRKAGLARPEPGLPVFGGFGPGADACALEAVKECPRREGPFNRTEKGVSPIIYKSAPFGLLDSQEMNII